jgi:hypothetical protein
MTTSTSTASFNRNDEWKRCCANAMGFEWLDQFQGHDQDRSINSRDNDQEQQQHYPRSIDSIQQVINLLDDNKNVDDEDDDNFEEEDIVVHNTQTQHLHKSRSGGWMESAIGIKNDLYTMKLWIESKSQSYVNLNMKDDEASLIQSTVTSFAATIASEIETLREMIVQSQLQQQSTVNNIQNHQSGIVQILLSQLQEYITEPFNKLQKQRTRIAVQIWQNPLQCKLYQRPIPASSSKTKKQPQDILFDDDDEEEEQQRQQPKDQRYLPKRSYDASTSDAVGYDFITKYERKPSTQIPPTQPDFLFKLNNSTNKRRKQCGREVESTNVGKQSSKAHTESSSSLQLDFQQKHQHQAPIFIDDVDYQQQLENDLQEETAQLTTQLISTNELDTVQQMERRMVEITTLIGQFSNLVQEQQEQILNVYDSAQTTKENMQKGQENLIDAAERTKRSKHFKAYIILGMSLTLLFFHLLKN